MLLGGLLGEATRPEGPVPGDDTADGYELLLQAGTDSSDAAAYQDTGNHPGG